MSRSTASTSTGSVVTSTAAESGPCSSCEVDGSVELYRSRSARREQFEILFEPVERRHVHAQ